MDAKPPVLRSSLRAAAFGLLAAVGIMAPALADCYDLVGCDNKDLFSRHYDDYLGSIANGPNCDFLYMMRNRIYQQHGYCFSTARAISTLGNDGCSVKNQAAVPLSNIERANIATIQRAESIRRCPG